MRRLLEPIRPLLPDTSDLLGLIGVGAIVHGIAQFSVPGAWITAGVLALAAALLLAKREGSR